MTANQTREFEKVVKLLDDPPKRSALMSRIKEIVQAVLYVVLFPFLAALVVAYLFVEKLTEVKRFTFKREERT